jgi:transcriptional regulator with XRE-family HTH domain
MTDLRKVLASNLKLYRKALGISQAKLAEMVDIAENYIALIETGRRFPSLPVLEKFATALQKDILELFSIKAIETSRKEALKNAIITDIEHILTLRLNETSG